MRGAFINSLATDARPFLDAANQLIRLAFHEAKVVVRQTRQQLLELAFGYIPIPFGY
jgi:hypothetical protein